MKGSTLIINPLKKDDYFSYYNTLILKILENRESTEMKMKVTQIPTIQR